MPLYDDFSQAHACGKHARNLRVSSPYFFETLIKYQRRVISAMDCRWPRGLPRRGSTPRTQGSCFGPFDNRRRDTVFWD